MNFQENKQKNPNQNNNKNPHWTHTASLFHLHKTAILFILVLYITKQAIFFGWSQGKIIQSENHQ